MPITAFSPENREALAKALRKRNLTNGEILVREVKDTPQHPMLSQLIRYDSLVEKIKSRAHDPDHPNHLPACE